MYEIRLNENEVREMGLDPKNFGRAVYPFEIKFKIPVDATEAKKRLEDKKSVFGENSWYYVHKHGAEYNLTVGSHTTFNNAADALDALDRVTKPRSLKNKAEFLEATP